MGTWRYKLAFLGSLCFCATTRAGKTPNRDSVHIVFTTECNNYFNWQSLGFVHSFYKAGQPGKLTRLVSCTDADRGRYKDIDVDIPTHFGPSWTFHPTSGDVYSGINKPVVVADWLNVAKPEEDYIIILDADMIMREPLDPVAMGVKPGWAVAAYFGYMKGVANELALRHVKEVVPHNDTFAGPTGRRGDQVGGFTMMLREDLQRMVPYWISYTEAVRADPEAWKYAGDAYALKPGDKCWISEMYGYSFGAAKAGVWHHTDHMAMLYPGYMPASPTENPNVLHYGLLYEVANTDYKFDKHWYRDFDALVCPPWNIKKNMGLFPHPPHPKDLKTKGIERLRDLLAIQVPATLNEALCSRHFAVCNASEQLTKECEKVASISYAVGQELKAFQSADCNDNDVRCGEWASRGECDSNPSYMSAQCRMSCHLCTEHAKARRRPPAPAFVRNHPQDRPHVLDPKHDELVTAARGDTQEGGTQGTGPHDTGAQGTENSVTGTQAGGDASTAKGDRVVDPVVSSDASKGSSAEAVSNATPQPTQASAGNDIQKSSLEDSLKALPDWALPAEFLKLNPDSTDSIKKKAKALHDMVLSSNKERDSLLEDHVLRQKVVSSISQLKAACARRADLSMSQVVDCYKAAEAGKEYEGEATRQMKAAEGGEGAAKQQPEGMRDRLRVSAHVQASSHEKEEPEGGGPERGQAGGAQDRGSLMRELHEKTALPRAPLDQEAEGWLSRSSLAFLVWVGVMAAWLAGPVKGRRLGKAASGTNGSAFDHQKGATPRRRRALDS